MKRTVNLVKSEVVFAANHANAIYHRDDNGYAHDADILSFERFSCRTTGCDAVTLEYDDKIVVVFKGTEFDKLNDLLTNVLFCYRSLSSYKKADVHAGYMASADIFMRRGSNKVFEWVNSDKNDKNKKDIYVIGHSLGGAVATLVASHLSSYTENKIKLFTFGSPEVGDDDFVQWFREKENIDTFRFVHDVDIVPCLWTWMNHPVNGIHVDRMGNITAHKEGFFRNMWRYIKMFFTNKEKALDSHYPALYLKSLEAMTDTPERLVIFTHKGS